MRADSAVFGGVSLVVLAAAMSLSPLAISASAQAPMAGFLDRVVLSGLTNPTAVRFSSDGRIFVAEKSGLIKVFDSLTDTNASVFADLRTNVHNYWDRGLLSLELDPGFPARPYVYVLYTFDGPVGGIAPRWGLPGQSADGCPDPPGGTADGCEVTGRISRLRAAGNSMTGTEQVLVHDWFQQFPGHSIGDLRFGPDGALYASGGEGASFQFVDYGQRGNPGGDPPAARGGEQIPPDAEGGALRSQDLRTAGDPTGLSGTLIRINPETGAAMPDNPMASHADPNARRIVAHGFRMPFRFTMRPGTNEIWVADVGWRSAEEIDRIINPLASPVRNFGWPCYEGAARQPAYDAAGLRLCETLYPIAGAMTSPHYQYLKGSAVVAGESCPSAGASITGIAFYSGGSYPSRYDGALFFADYTRRCIWVMTRGANGLPDPATRATFVGSAGYPVDLRAGPGGDLFYVDFTRGAIRRISYSSGNTPPVASISAAPTSGLAPLTVRFDGGGSTDAEDGSVRYDWDLDGNGQFGDSALVNPSYTYTSVGVRTISLRVTDTGGLSHAASIRITVGNTAPTALIQAPAATLRWRVGQTIAFSGSASDPQQGTLPASSLTWALVMHHCATPGSCHEHPIQSMTGSAGSFVAPDHEYPSYLTLRLSARDNGGLEHAVVRRLDPQTVDLRFESAPTGLELGFGSGTLTSPAVRTVIVGSAISISAPSPQILGGRSYQFSSWSHGGPPNQEIIAPPTPATYTARFVPSANYLPAGWSTTRVGGSGSTGSAVHASGRFDVDAYGQDVWGTSDAFQFVHRSLTGDGEVVARVSAVSLPAGASFALAGVMIRESAAAGSRHAAVLIGSNGKLKFRRRVTAGGTTLSDGPSEGSLSIPYWVRLVRTGNVFRAYRSPDGRTWTETGPATTLALPATVQVGLVALRSGSSTATRASFDAVDISAAGLTGADIGAVGSPGSHARDGGTLVLRGGGTDVWAAADALHYLHRPWSGDGDITVHLRSLQSPTGANWAMAGLMFRESLAAGARHVSLLLSTDGKLKFRRRGVIAGPTLSDGPSVGSATVPRWLRLTRRGNTFTAFHSSDGVTWTQVHTPQVLALPSSLFVGTWTLRNGGTGLAHAAFSSLIISPPQ